MFRFASESGHLNGDRRAHRQCPLCPVWMVPALQELFEAWRLGQEQSCVRPVGAGENPLAMMGSADRVPLYITDKRCPGLSSEFLDPRSDPDCHHFASSLQTVIRFRSSCGLIRQP